MNNTPSDADIISVMRDGYNCRYNDEADHVDFARAVLAKWGTPQPVVREPLTNEQRMEVFNEAMKRCDENLNLPWRVAILEQVEIAHGITQKGGQHGTDN